MNRPPCELEALHGIPCRCTCLHTVHPVLNHAEGCPSPDKEQDLISALLWFLDAPNGYIDGQRPVELLGRDNERILSLAKAFLHPADVF